FPINGLRLRQPLGRPVLVSLLRVIQEWNPDLIIPGDEPTVRFLCHIVERAQAGYLETLPAGVLELIERSLGTSGSSRMATDKAAVQRIAREASVCAPACQRVSEVPRALAFAEELGYPVVVKQDFSYG